MTPKQIQKLELVEQLLMAIISSVEFESLVNSGNYHPDINLSDALEAVSYLLDHCSSCSPYPVPRVCSNHSTHSTDFEQKAHTAEEQFQSVSPSTHESKYSSSR